MSQPGFSGKQSRVRKILSNKWLWLLLVVILAGLAWYFFRGKTATGPGQFGGPGGGRNNTAVGVAAVETADIPIVLNALGTVTATATATVRPQVSGVLQQVNFQEGQMVKAGQVLVTIDPRPFELALMQASGQRQRDQAQLDNAKIILARDKILQSQDSIAQQDVEAQAALVKQLEGTVMSDLAQEGTAKLNLSYTKVTAPVSGRLGLRTIDIGNLVSSSDAAGIAVITQLTPIDVEFSVPQNQVADVQAGLHPSDEPKLQVTSAAAAKPLKVMVFDRSRTNLLANGEFLALDNQMDVQTGTVKAKARFANEKQQLFPNEFVNIQVILRQIKDATVIPVSALRHGASGDFVYVLDTETSTVSQRPVTAGQADVEKVQITAGVKPGEKVITEGADRLKDGAKVNLPSNAPARPGGNGNAEQKPEHKSGNWKRDGAGAGNADAPAGEGAGKKREWPKKSEGNGPSAGSAAGSGSSESSASSASGEHRHKRQSSES